jgi:hypothetical protein
VRYETIDAIDRSQIWPNSGALPYIAASMPFADIPQTREELPRDKLTALVDDNALDRMLKTRTIEPGFLSLIAGANAALAALDARKQSKETA